jgi:hypothetical protein
MAAAQGQSLLLCLPNKEGVCYSAWANKGPTAGGACQILDISLK